jgi:hypothetical protein
MNKYAQYNGMTSYKKDKKTCNLYILVFHLNEPGWIFKMTTTAEHGLA